MMTAVDGLSSINQWPRAIWFGLDSQQSIGLVTAFGGVSLFHSSVVS
jgi:hypothetical protein